MSLSDTIESCYQRSKQKLGSSSLWEDEIEAGGIMSTDTSISQFANWTKVLFIYCDGALHQGYSKTPLKYKDA